MTLSREGSSCSPRGSSRKPREPEPRSSSIPRRSWKSHWRRRRVSAGQASTAIWFRASSAPGCFWAPSLPICRSPPDPPEPDHCGTCQACLDICPTKAFPRPYVLDARRCISYLTIEHKGHIGREFRPLIGNRIFGCDDCLAVCPWNKFAATAREAKLRAREELSAPPIADLLRLDDAAFRALFTGSAVKRIGYDRFTRNVLIAAGNSGDLALAGLVAERLKSPSALLRAMAVWALARLVSPDDLAEFERRSRPGETDEAVEAEWAASWRGDGASHDRECG